MVKLFPYQKVGIKTTKDNLKRHKLSFIFDEMGLGKTIQAIGLIKAMKPTRTLIVVPPNLKYNWFKELMDAGIKSIDLIETGKQYVNEKKKVILCGYSISIQKYIIAQMDRINFDFIIFDEVHYLKASKANKRTKYFTKFLSKRPKAYKTGLTGTPIVNSVVDLWCIYNVFKADYFFRKGYNYLAFCYNFAKSVQSTPYGLAVKGVKNGSRLRSLIQDTAIRRLKKQVRKELPEKVRNRVLIDPNNSKIKKLIQAEQNIIDILEVDDYEDIHNICTTRDILFEEIAEIRQKIGILKIPFVYEEITSLVYTGTAKLICYVIFHNTVHELTRYLNRKKIKAKAITGLLSGQKRLQAIEKFKTSDDQVLVCSLGSVKEGLNIQFLHTCVIGELGWSVVDHEQGEDRLHRIGQRYDCSYTYVMIDGGFDKRIDSLLKQKKEVVKSLDPV